jgi:hypothetical protein
MFIRGIEKPRDWGAPEAFIESGAMLDAGVDARDDVAFDVEPFPFIPLG